MAPNLGRRTPAYICFLMPQKLRRDIGREALLSDLPRDERKKWRCYAKWSQDPTLHGQISVLLVSMAKKIAGVDWNAEFPSGFKPGGY